MDIYCVGGAVRDELLGLTVQDRDWVVVGASPEAMIARGFVPVGRDFPVFLHPDTHEEYALARTERKTGRGYHGFTFHCAPEVTLEEDLRRRDLTINAMARSQDGRLIDPYGGLADLRAGRLRHVSEAFAEDPVRILRVARFAARLPDFSVAERTLELMRAMVVAGEVDALVAERTWQEIERGLMAERPARMLAVLGDCGAIERLLPEWAELAAPARLARMRALDDCALRGHGLDVRYAVMTMDGPLEAEIGLARACSARLKVPRACRELAELAAREGSGLLALERLDAQSTLTLLERLDVLRRPQRAHDALLACEALARAQQSGLDRGTAPPSEAESAVGLRGRAARADRLHACIEAVRRVNAQSITAQVRVEFAQDAAQGAPEALVHDLAGRIRVALGRARLEALQALPSLGPDANAQRQGPEHAAAPPTFHTDGHTP